MSTNTLTQNPIAGERPFEANAFSCEAGEKRQLISLNKFPFEVKLEFFRKTGHEMGYVSSRIFLTAPNGDSSILKTFLNEYEQRLNALAPECHTIERFDDYICFAVIASECEFTNGRKEKCLVGQIGENATFRIAHKETNQFIGNISFRMFGQRTLELSRMMIDEDARRNGLGTNLVNIAKQIAVTLNLRFILLPCPPKAEVEIQGWNDNHQFHAAKENLIRWYAKLGFVLCHTEYIDVVRVSGKKKMLLGITGMMSYR